ncbi:MAG TPA: HEAT repeat domain-containing protein [Terriglobales bacterium]|jgi:anti-sigma factor RsiW|nr:HEAT repeat domain-containing protein [Terriglobales bacterium]
MKCEWVRENITLYIYNELADDARYELEQHVARCTDCTAELKAGRKLHATLSQFPVEEPTPNLLAASRMRLQEALETTEQGGFWHRLVFDPAAWLHQIRFSPALAAVILIVGFAGGVGTTYQLVGNHNRIVGPVPAPAQSSITGIQSISQEPGSNQVTIKYNTVSTQETQGSLNDQRIQQLLLFAARNNYNSGVRMDSVDLLTQQPNDTHVREALMYALRYDSNPGVRLKALDGLGSYVKNDVRVRDAVLEALENDSNPGVRTEALRLIEPVRADSSVRAVLQKLADSDQNQYIRSQARTSLAQLPEID